MLIELAMLTCLEATQIADNIDNADDMPLETKQELIREVYNNSECKNGNV